MIDAVGQARSRSLATIGVDGADGVRGGRRLDLAEGGQRRVGMALPPAFGVPHRLAVAHEQHAGGLEGVARHPGRR